MQKRQTCNGQLERSISSTEKLAILKSLGTIVKAEEKKTTDQVMKAIKHLHMRKMSGVHPRLTAHSLTKL